MKLIRFGISLVLYTFVSFVCSAKPGIKITEPQNGTVVISGQDLTIRLEAVDGLVCDHGQLIVGKIFASPFNNLPAIFSVDIPLKTGGNLPIAAYAVDASGKIGGAADVSVIVRPDAELIGFDFDMYKHFSFEADWEGNLKPDQRDYVRVDALYEDEITREIDIAELTFTSLDPQIASIEMVNDLVYIVPHKVGKTKIIASKDDVTGEINVDVNLPSGLRPAELIPPVTTIDIQPQANSSGWYNKDLNIQLTAQDNQDGSGVRGIYYRFQGTAKPIYQRSSTVNFNHYEEGSRVLNYWSVDNEGNEDVNKITINLDKTPPAVSIKAEPSVLWPPNGKMVDVKIIGKANDGLSGINNVQFNVVDEYGKRQPVITGFGSTIKLEASREGKDKDGRVYTISAIVTDKAGNKRVETTTVVCPHDQGKK